MTTEDGPPPLSTSTTASVQSDNHSIHCNEANTEDAIKEVSNIMAGSFDQVVLAPSQESDDTFDIRIGVQRSIFRIKGADDGKDMIEQAMPATMDAESLKHKNVDVGCKAAGKKKLLPMVPVSTVSMSVSDSDIYTSCLDTSGAGCSGSEDWTENDEGINAKSRYGFGWKRGNNATTAHRWMVGAVLILIVGCLVGSLARIAFDNRIRVDPDTGSETSEESDPVSKNPTGDTEEDNILYQLPGTRPKETNTPKTKDTTKVSSQEPAEAPSQEPTEAPSRSTLPTAIPTATPTITPTEAALEFVPGDLKVQKHGVLLSEGLDIRILATSGKKVEYGGFKTGKKSEEKFITNPDAGATFAVPDTAIKNRGGWVYVVNSEVQNKRGGVGALTFNKYGEIISYKRILKGTSMNCGGGRTPWRTWVTLEEERKTRDGQIYEVDPFGSFSAKTVLGGKKGGAFESFAYDVRNKSIPHFFYTEDHDKGALRRFTPSTVTWEDPSSMLRDDEGKIEYLILKQAGGKNSNEGTYTWSTKKKDGEKSALAFFPGTEGIDVSGNELFFISKTNRKMFVLDLDRGTWKASSTKQGKFDGQPDQIVRILGDKEQLLCFTEDGGTDAGIHCRDKKGRLFTILESPLFEEETTGLAFSPDNKHMYLAYQKNGLLFDVWRTDGEPFTGKALSMKYHKTKR